MRVAVMQYKKLANLTAEFKPGVHIITGPSFSGKTRFADAIAWCITGTDPGGDVVPAGSAVKVLVPGAVVIERRVAEDGKQVVTLRTKEGIVDIPDEVMTKNGFVPAILSQGAGCLFSEFKPEPTGMVSINGTLVPAGSIQKEELVDQYKRLRYHLADLEYTRKRVGEMKAKVELEAQALRKEVQKLREQEELQCTLGTLHLMNINECPLYQVTCTCKDRNVELVKQDLRDKMKGKQPSQDYFPKLRSKEYELAKKELEFKLLSERSFDGSDKPIEARIEEEKAQLAGGEEAIATIDRYVEWKSWLDRIQPIVALKDRIVSAGKSLGLDIVYKDGFFLNSVRVENAGRAERVMLDYCLQIASGAPIVMVDDFDVPDLGSKERLLQNAGQSNRTVLFLASSSVPRAIPGALSWHLSNGVLEPYGRPQS